jgi:hypothetical protein
MYKTILIFVCSFFLFPSSEIIAQKTIRLFFMGGQSNMDGYGFNKDLPASLNKSFRNVWIFHGNPAPDGNRAGGLGKWEPLRPGHGVGFKFDGQNNLLSDRFGAELSFAKRLTELYPGDQIAIIKYSRGGTSIDSVAAGEYGSWDPDYPGINQYDHFLKTLRNALQSSDINNDGQVDNLIPSGIIWMQGESDANMTEAVANRYYENLYQLMQLMRAAFREKNLPVILGKISDSWTDTDGLVWDHGDLVQAAQEKFVRLDGHADIIRTTKYYRYSDVAHYNSNGYVDMGLKFAEALFYLPKE